MLRLIDSIRCRNVYFILYLYIINLRVEINKDSIRRRNVYFILYLYLINLRMSDIFYID
jgi:hypothetical protein